MNTDEILTALDKAENELRPVFDFIKAGRITPNNGVLGYLYGTAQLRSNDLREAMSNLRVTAIQYAREKEKSNG